MPITLQRLQELISEEQQKRNNKVVTKHDSIIQIKTHSTEKTKYNLETYVAVNNSKLQTKINFLWKFIYFFSSVSLLSLFIDTFLNALAIVILQHSVLFFLKMLYESLWKYLINEDI